MNEQTSRITQNTELIQIKGLPAFDSNYLWVVHNHRHAWVVDPGDADVVQQYLTQQQLTLTGILITHHHADHVGGVLALKQRYPNATIIGPMTECIEGLEIDAKGGEHYTLTGLTDPQEDAQSPAITVQCIDVAGHTAGHVAYFIAANPAVKHVPHLFCGDTMFAAGCGRLFEGTPAQMHDSLHRLMQLPANTLAYCAHEYTASNLNFAAAVEPNNPAIQARATHTASMRSAGKPTVPFVLGDEIHSNVFLRTHMPEVCASASAHAGLTLVDSVDVFAELRQWKNNF